MRAYAIVFLLLISTIGFPVGVFLLVRYQFIAQTVMLEDLDGRRALRRSGRLTNRRWLHTAVVSAGLNGLVIVSAVAAGLVLLLLVPGLPLWAFSALAAVVYAVLVPLAAISMTLLYGDAVAEQEDLPGGLARAARRRASGRRCRSRLGPAHRDRRRRARSARAAS